MARPVRILAVVVMAVVGSALSAPQASAEESPEVRVLDGSPSRELRWSGCPDSRGQECATLVVPRAYGRPDGPTVSLLVRRLPAERSPARGVVIANPGGPGGTSEMAFQSLTDHPLRRHFDIISWDPRGVGSSRPTLEQCPAQVNGQPEPIPLTGRMDWVALGRDGFAWNSAANLDCLAVNRSARHAIATARTVKDVDRLRSALGLERINFLGTSYGTTIGRLYAQRYPGRVRTLTLDGVVAPDPTVPGVLRERMAVAPRALAHLRKAMGPDLWRAYRQMSDILLREGSPTVNRWAMWGAALNATRGQFLFQTYRLYVCAMLPQMGISTPSGCESSAAAAAPRETSPIQMMVDCGEQPGRVGRSAVESLVNRSARTSPEIGAFAAIYSGLCSGTPEAWNGLPPARAVRLATPPLVMNSTADIATPFRGARRTALLFPGARFLTARSSFHALVEVRSRCLDRALVRYLSRRELPSRDRVCPVPELGDRIKP